MKWDFTAVHWYGSYNDLDGFKNAINAQRNAFPNKPVWVTEYATTQKGELRVRERGRRRYKTYSRLLMSHFTCLFPLFRAKGGGNYDQTKQFLTDSTNWLESVGWVERAFYFGGWVKYEREKINSQSRHWALCATQTYFRSPCGLSLSSIPLTETKIYLLFFPKTAFSFQLEHQSRWIRKQQQQVLQQWWWFDWSRLQMGLQLDCFQYIVLKIWRYLPFRDSTYCRRSRQRQHFPFTLPKTLKGDSTLLLSIFLLLSSSLLGYLWNTVRPNSIPRSLLPKCFLSEPLRAQSQNFLVHPLFQIR